MWIVTIVFVVLTAGSSALAQKQVDNNEAAGTGDIEAHSRVRTLEQQKLEEQAWKGAVASKSSESYRSFLTTYPESVILKDLTEDELFTVVKAAVQDHLDKRNLELFSVAEGVFEVSSKTHYELRIHGPAKLGRLVAPAGAVIVIKVAQGELLLPLPTNVKQGSRIRVYVAGTIREPLFHVIAIR